MEEFIGNYLNRLNTKNYNQIELTFGNKLFENTFDVKISKDLFSKLKKYFIQIDDSTVQQLENKIYYVSNKELHINNSYQQRVYKTHLYDYLFVDKNPTMPFDMKITFSERKMISIENFPTCMNYESILFKKITSVNVKNKFYVNFNEIINEKNETTLYSLTILIKRKTSLLSTLQMMLNQICSIIKLVHWVWYY